MYANRRLMVPALVAQRGGIVRYNLVATCPLCFGHDYRTWCISCRAWPQMPLRLALEISVPAGITTGKSLRLSGPPLPDHLTLYLGISVLPQAQARTRAQSEDVPERRRRSPFGKIFGWLGAGLLGADTFEMMFTRPPQHHAAPAQDWWAHGTARSDTAASGSRPEPGTYDLFRNAHDPHSYDNARSRSYERENTFRHGGNGYEADREAQRRDTAEQDRRYREEQASQRRDTEERERRYREEQAAQRRHAEEQERRYREDQAAQRRHAEEQERRYREQQDRGR